jgi:hypothetical protein
MESWGTDAVRMTTIGADLSSGIATLLWASGVEDQLGSPLALDPL